MKLRNLALLPLLPLAAACAVVMVAGALGLMNLGILAAKIEGGTDNHEPHPPDRQ